MTCPLCKTGTIKKGDRMVYCDGYQAKKDGNTWFNAGTCDFHISFNQKGLGRTLDDDEMRDLLNGKVLRNPKGDTLQLDIENKPFFTKMVFMEDKDF